MKKTILLVLLFSFALCGFSQKIKEKGEAVGTKNKIPGIVTPLTKEQVVKLDFPQKLNYWEFAQAIGGIFPANLRNMPAKQERGSKPVDYTFEVVTPGLEYMGHGGAKSFDANTKVIDVRFKFPFKVVVKDKSDNVIKTLMLDDGTKMHSETFHPNMFDTPEFGASTFSNPIIAGFPLTANGMVAKLLDDEKKVLARAEYNQYAEHMRNIIEVISATYGEIGSSKPTVMTVDKKFKSEFTELDEQINQFAGYVSEVYEGQYSKELLDQIKTSAQYFSSQYNQNSSKEMKRICSFNATLAYAIADEGDKAEEQFYILSDQIGAFSTAGVKLRDMFDDFALINMLRKEGNKETFDLSAPLTLAHRKQEVLLAKEEQQQNAAKIQQAQDDEYLTQRIALNIVAQPGGVRYIKKAIGNNREVTEEGLVTILFVDPSNGNSAPAELHLKDKEGDDLNFQTTNFISAGIWLDTNRQKQRLFESVTEVYNKKEAFKGALFGVKNEAFSGVMESIEEYAMHKVYYCVQGDYYLLGRWNGKESPASACRISNLINEPALLSKIIKGEETNPTKLEEALKNGEITDTKEGALKALKLLYQK